MVAWPELTCPPLGRAWAPVALRDKETQATSAATPVNAAPTFPSMISASMTQRSLALFPINRYALFICVSC